MTGSRERSTQKAGVEPWGRYRGGRRPPSDDSLHSRQTEYHEALPTSSNVQSHLTSSFADDGNASGFVECRHLTVVGLHDTGPRSGCSIVCLLFSTSLVKFFQSFAHPPPPPPLPPHVGLVVKASASRVTDLGSTPDFALDLFLGPAISVTKKLEIQSLPWQVPCIKGLTLGLVDPVSIFADWMR